MLFYRDNHGDMEDKFGMLQFEVVGIYGSPREGGNTDILLDRTLEGARAAGATITQIYARDLNIAGCRACGGCDETGKCIIMDNMQSVYPSLQTADIIFLASPIFFYGMSSQVKVIIDRCQSMWAGRLLRKTPDERKIHDSGRGYLIAVGATKGKNLFDGVQLTAKYFFDVLDMSYEGGIFFRRIDAKKAIMEHPEALEKAFDLGFSVVRQFSPS